MMNNKLHKEVKKKIKYGIEITVAANNQVYFSMDTMIDINMAVNKIQNLAHRIVNT